MLGYIKKNPLQILFIVSLLFNGFLLGLLMAGPGFHGHKGPNPMQRMSRHADMLDPEIRTKVLSIIENQDQKINRQKQDSEAFFKEMRNTLTSGNPDPEEIKVLFNQMAQHHEKMGMYIGEMFSEIAAVIPDPDQKAAFFKEALPGPGGFPGPMGPPPPHHGPGGFEGHGTQGGRHAPAPPPEPFDEP